jgi:hypothetical protein
MKLFYWADSYFKKLKEVAEEARENSAWADYALFCENYERGLRSQAFAILERFVVVLAASPFSERRDFVSWLMQRVDGVEASHRLMPHPLYNRIVKPTLEEWIVVEPESSEPHRWLGGREHLMRALELNPKDEVARQKLVNFLLHWVDWCAHEIPSGYGYLEDPQEGLADLEEAETLSADLSNSEDRSKAHEKIQWQRALIQEYLQRLQNKG